MRLHTILLSCLALLGLAYAADAGGGRDEVFTTATQFAFIDDSELTVQLPTFPSDLGTLTGVQVGVEVDASFSITATSSAPLPDPFYASWSASLSGQPVPPPSAIGQDGYASYSLIAHAPGGGGIVGKSSYMPVQAGTLMPGVPTNFFADVDGLPGFGQLETDPRVLGAFQKGDTVDIPVVTAGNIWTVGCPQGTIATNCSAVGRVYVRYFYTAN